MEGRGPGYSCPAKGESGVREIAVAKRISHQTLNFIAQSSSQVTLSITLTSIPTGRYQGRVTHRTRDRESSGIPDGWSATRTLPVSKANTQFLYTFDAANASREIRTEQAAIGSFVRESPHSAQAEIDGSWSQLPGFQITPGP